MTLRYLLLGTVLLTSCGEKNTFAPPPPMPVGVMSPIVRAQQTYSEYSGRIEALQIAEVRAQASGTLVKISDRFEQGRRVQAETLLFEIDKAPYEAALKAAGAKILQAKANVTITKATWDAREAAGRGVSDIEKASAKAAWEEAVANEAAATAERDKAKINLDYCTIYAPITGRISEVYVDQFNLVGTGEPTLLCTIVNDDEMHVYFEADERRSLEFLRRRKGYEEEDRTPPQATLTMADGTVYGHPAQLELTDNKLDSETGTLMVRGVVPNPDGALADGLFVRIKVPKPDGPKESILIPSKIIQQDLGGFYVLTVGEDNTVVRKNIKLTKDRITENMTDLRIVSEGLSGDEKIIVTGIQRVREGVPVAPKEAPPAGKPAPPAAPEAPAGS